MGEEFEISEAVQKQIGDSAVAAMQKYQEEHLDERLKKSDSEMKVLREKMTEINEKADKIRQETAFKIADNDAIRQGLRANIAYEVMKRLAAKEGQSIEPFQKAQQQIVKALYPQLERKYKYDPVYMHCKTQIADKYKVEKSALFKSNMIEVEKADMASATAGAGAEFLVTVYSAELTRFTAEMAPIAGKFRTITVPGGKYNKKNQPVWRVKVLTHGAHKVRLQLRKIPTIQQHLILKPVRLIGQQTGSRHITRNHMNLLLNL